MPGISHGVLGDAIEMIDSYQSNIGQECPGMGEVVFTKIVFTSTPGRQL